EESYFSVFKLAESQVKCTCGVVYCSDNCKNIAYAQHHALLCPHTEERENAMGQFLNHTLVTNEIFQLAAKVVAKILLLFVATQDVGQARLPVDMFCKLPWWEVITSEEDLEEGETLEEYRDKFRSLISQTFEHFIGGLKENLTHLEGQGELHGLTADAVLASCNDLLNVDFFSRVVGMFEMNNISMEIDHPFHALGEALSEASPEEKKDMPPVLSRVKAALEKFTEEHKHHLCDEEDEHENEHEECYALDEDFVGVEGTALFSGICTMNHSCDPNCTVLYTKDGAAHVFAVQDIAEGEELCISYIDVDQEVDEREDCLRLLCFAFTATCVDAAVGSFSPETCTKCAGLEYCTIMNGQYLFDPIAGYSREANTQLEKQGVCEDLDVKTLALSSFGSQVQFKDTSACHKLVWNFHCLSWVTTMFQRNVNGTPVSCAQTNSATVPLPPCRSLCVELADKCVYSHLYRMYLDEVCGNIKCLSEIQEAKNTGAVNTNIAETTCVSGSWVYDQNKTLSRCSTRAYQPPTSLSVSNGVVNSLIRQESSMDDSDSLPPWKALKASAKSGLRSARPDLNRYACVAAPYGPADPVASTYFQVVISKAKAPIICGDAGPVKGKAIYADRDLAKATRIWTESPLVAMQHERNRDRLLCCQFCYLPLLADAQQQWREIVTRFNSQSDGPTTTTTEQLQAVDVDALEKTLGLLRITPQSCGMAGPGAMCTCGELYCSKLCRMRALHEYHAILCPRNDPCSAMGEFMEHTRHTNDIFLLAAKVIARVISRYLVWRDIVKAREPIDMFYKKPWWEVVVIEHDENELMNPQNSQETPGRTTNSDDRGSDNDDRSPNDVKDIDDEHKASPEANVNAAEVQQTQPMEEEQKQDGDWMPGPRSATNGSTKAQCLQEVLAMTHQLLVDALECNLVRLEREGQLRGVTVDEIWRCCSSVLSFEFFTAQIGLFEMNNVSLEVDNPFHAFIDILDPDVQHEVAADLEHSDDPVTSTSPRVQPLLNAEDETLIASVRRVLMWEEERLQVLQAQERLEMNGSTTDWDFDPTIPLGYPGIEGTALFPIICTMNHSCNPNCTVMYTKNGDGHVVAIRDIQKGEELCICYIDIDMDVQTREANLREYKFKCFCSRCVQERQELEQQSPSLSSPAVTQRSSPNHTSPAVVQQTTPTTEHQGNDQSRQTSVDQDHTAFKSEPN
ncbi:hypothetical protein PHMEG_00020624, partial [Phytophthora megakarya]